MATESTTSVQQPLRSREPAVARGSSGFFLLCMVHAAVAVGSGALMIFSQVEAYAWGHGREAAARILRGSTPRDELLIRTSDAFAGLLLCAVGALIFMTSWRASRGTASSRPSSPRGARCCTPPRRSGACTSSGGWRSSSAIGRGSSSATSCSRSPRCSSSPTPGARSTTYRSVSCSSCSFSRFTPEALTLQFTNGLLGWFLQVILIRVLLYSLGRGEAPLLDIVAYAGYGFAGTSLVMLVHIFWSFSYYLVLPWFCICTGVFLVKTMKRVLLGAPRSYERHPSRNHYFLLFLAVVQFPILFWLGNISG